MSTRNSQVRPEHSPRGDGPVVAVTGAATGVGRLLVERLGAAVGSASGPQGLPAPGRVVAVDEGPAPDGLAGAHGVEWRSADVCDPALASRLRGVDVVVHADTDRSADTPRRERRARAVRAAQTVLTAAAAERVPQAVLVTGTAVYGAAPDNPVPLPEDTPVRTEGADGLAGDFAEVEEVGERARRAHPGLSVAVVRPAPLVGPGLDTVVGRHFAAPRLISVKGVEQRWQFCHVEDLASALELVALGGAGGGDTALAVGCDGSLGQEETEEITGLRRFEVPPGIAFGATGRLHRAGITPAAAGDLKHLVYPCVVDCAVLREAGWKPAYGNADALRELVQEEGEATAIVGRRLGRKEAAVTAAGAAGAAVAAIGTAAAVRRLRKRRKS